MTPCLMETAVLTVLLVAEELVVHPFVNHNVLIGIQLMDLFRLSLTLVLSARHQHVGLGILEKPGAEDNSPA